MILNIEYPPKIFFENYESDFKHFVKMLVDEITNVTSKKYQLWELGFVITFH